MYFEQLNADSCKSYLLFNEKTKSAIIIDPKSDYVSDYLEILKKRGANLNMVVDTHTHLDYVSGARYLKEKTGCKYAMHERSQKEGVDIKLKNNDTLDIEGIKFKVIYTPGHTKDSICIAWQDRLFTGDILSLNKGLGRTDSSNINLDQYWKSLLRLKGIDDHYIICPGHIYDESTYSTVWLQKRNNTCLRLDSKKKFKQYMKRHSSEIQQDIVNTVEKVNLKEINDIKDEKIVYTNPLCEDEISVIGQCKYITAEEFKNKVQNKEEIFVLDVRNKVEIADDQSDIIGTINIPLNELSANIYKLNEYLEKEIIIMCRWGKKSQRSWELLKNLGFSKVCILKGGINQYKENFEM